MPSGGRRGAQRFGRPAASGNHTWCQFVLAVSPSAPRRMRHSHPLNPSLASHCQSARANEDAGLQRWSAPSVYQWGGCKHL
jgi:hypothetical protein